MNKVFRIVWSEARQAWLVVSELTKIKGKSKAERQGQNIQSAVAFSSIFSSFPFHLLPHIVLLGLFSLSLPAEAAWTQAGGSVFNGGDENTIAVMGKAGSGSIAIGGGDNTSKANATGRTSVAIGYKADTGNYNNAVAVGNFAKGLGNSSVAIGDNATINGAAKNAVVIGHNASTIEDNRTLENDGVVGGHSPAAAVAIGDEAKAAYSSVAIGSSAKAAVSQTIAIGDQANATHNNAIAIGVLANATHNTANAIGYEAKAVGEYALAFGSNTTASAKSALAVNYGATARGGASIALGRLSNATGLAAAALSAGAQALADRTIAIGENKDATDGHSTGGAKASADDAISIGTSSAAGGKSAVAMGSEANATAEYAIAIGSNASAARYSVAVGKDSVANQTGSTALGENAKATQQRATALGNNSNATIANGSVAIGYQSVTTKDKGDQGWKQNSSNYSSLSGNVQTATHAAVAIGNNSTVTRQITGLAAGSADTDAVNVAQLKSLTLELKAGNHEGNVTLSNEKLEIKGANGITTNVSNNVVTVTGSGLTVTPDSNGTYSSPNSTLDIKTNEAWDADNNGGRYSGDNIETRKTANGILIGIKEEPTFKKVTINGNGPVLSSTGIAMNNQKITGLKPGEQETDAVNKKQLDDSIGSTTYKAQHGETNGYTIKHNENKTITIKPGDINDSGTFKAANLATSVDSTGNITIGFKEDPSFKDVTASNSIKINGGITINSTGIDMGAGGNRKITNLANGTESNDAVNFSQLQEVKNSIQNLQGGNVKVQSTSPNQITATKEGDTIKVGANVVGDIETGKDGKASLPQGYDTNALVTANAVIAAVNDGSWLVKTTDKTGWENKDLAYINPGDEVVYANGNGTTAEVSNKAENGKDTLTVKINVNTGTTEVDNTGKAKPKTDQDNNKIATLADITKTINDTSWTVTSGFVNSGSVEGNSTEEKIKAGDKVTLQAGDNLKITQNGKSFTYALAQTLNNISSISNGTDNVGTKITLSPDSKKIDVNHAVISNVSTPLNDDDAANKKYVDDLGNKGITFKANANQTKAIKLGDTVNIVGTNTNQITTTADGNGNVSIGVKTIPIDIREDGKAHLAQLWTDKKGGVGENLVTADAVITAINNAGFFVKTTDKSGESDPTGNKDWAWVSPGYRVVYENGTGTTVSVSQTKDPKVKGDKNTLLKVKVDVNTGTSTVDNTGKAKPTTDDDKKKIATLEDITNTINNTFWKATSGTVDGGIQEGQASVVNMKAGDMLTFKAGKNLKVKQDSNSFIYSLNDALSGISSISNGNEGVGTKITLSPNEKKIDVGGARITNVGTPSQESDVVNKKYVDNLNNALGNKGITFAADKGQTNPIKLGEQLKIVGANPNQITTTVNENGTISIGAKVVDDIETGEDGKASLPESYNKNSLVTANAVIAAVNDASWLVKTTDKTGWNNQDLAYINPGDEVVYANGNGTTAVVSNKVDNGKDTLTVKYDVNTGTSIVDDTGKAKPKTEDDKNKIATLEDITNTINGTFWKATSGTVEGGEQGGTASEAQIKAGDMVTLKAGKNMKITQEDKSFTYALKEAIDFTSVTTGNTSMNNDGITIKAPADAQDGRSNVTLTANGLDNGGNKITHVADGEVKQDSKDAVNGGQLHNLVKVNNAAAENNGSVNFIAGDGTTVAAENGNIKVNVNKADLTTDLAVGNDGKVVEPTGDENKAKFVSAEKIAKSINDTFWKVTSGTDGGSEAADSQKSEQQIKAGDMVSLKAGKNLTIKQDGPNFTFALSDTLKIDNLNVGEKGADGKPGEDGKISVNGKDGSSVVLNGKDGSIGLNGKDGKDGVTIKSADG
ncbi:MAG: ESPR-type extended signal peptide-containing protein, partial [[Pasteurella] aerogenes]|nr:ESPR-type extended signal peptide-containing protein [[Pasteurella] aerogenes]